MVTDEQVQHPHHPWQSWRDRWVKNLSRRRRQDLPVEDSQPELAVRAPPETAARSPEPSEAAVKPEPQHRIRKAQPSGASASASASLSKRHAKGRGRNFFTEEEDKLLLDYIRVAQEHNKTAMGNRVKSLSGNKIYQEFAEEVSKQTKFPGTQITLG